MAYQVGIVGGGNISETHARAALEIPSVEIAAVQGPNAAKVAKLAERYGCAPYADVDALLGHPGLDLVLLGSPSGLHAEQGTAAARRGIHVLSEKPLDVGTERIDALIAECDRAGVKLGVFFQDRTAPDLAWLKRLVDGGGLGEPILASARVRWYRTPEYYSGSRWRGTWALDGGGAVMNQGIHTVDLLLWLLGDPTRVWARTRAALHDIEVEDVAVATLEFPGGALATFEATTAAYPGYPRRLEISGTNGTVVVEGDRVVGTDLKEPPAEPPPGRGSMNPSANSPTVSDVAGHRRVLEDFLRAIEAGETPRSDGREGRRSVALVEAMYRSSRSGEPVTLHPPVS